MCDALLMPADISEQTESIRAKGTTGLDCNWWDLDSRAYFSLFLASAAVATALASLVASDMYDGRCEGVNTSKVPNKSKIRYRSIIILGTRECNIT